MKKTLFVVSTTFIGAWGVSELYFDERDKAEKFLNEECVNGEITKIVLVGES